MLARCGPGSRCYSWRRCVGFFDDVVRQSFPREFTESHEVEFRTLGNAAVRVVSGGNAAPPTPSQVEVLLHRQCVGAALPRKQGGDAPGKTAEYTAGVTATEIGIAGPVVSAVAALPRGVVVDFGAALNEAVYRKATAFDMVSRLSDDELADMAGVLLQSSAVKIGVGVVWPAEVQGVLDDNRSERTVRRVALIRAVRGLREIFEDPLGTDAPQRLPPNLHPNPDVAVAQWPAQARGRPAKGRVDIASVHLSETVPVWEKAVPQDSAYDVGDAVTFTWGDVGELVLDGATATVTESGRQMFCGMHVRKDVRNGTPPEVVCARILAEHARRRAALTLMQRYPAFDFSDAREAHPKAMPSAAHLYALSIYGVLPGVHNLSHAFFRGGPGTARSAEGPKAWQPLPIDRCSGTRCLDPEDLLHVPASAPADEAAVLDPARFPSMHGDGTGPPGKQSIDAHAGDELDRFVRSEPRPPQDRPPLLAKVDAIMDTLVTPGASPPTDFKTLFHSKKAKPQQRPRHLGLDMVLGMAPPAAAADTGGEDVLVTETLALLEGKGGLREGSGGRAPRKLRRRALKPARRRAKKGTGEAATPKLAVLRETHQAEVLQRDGGAQTAATPEAVPRAVDASDDAALSSAHDDHGFVEHKSDLPTALPDEKERCSDDVSAIEDVRREQSVTECGFDERIDVSSVDDADPIVADVVEVRNEDVFVVDDTDPVPKEEHGDRCSDNESAGYAAEPIPPHVYKGCVDDASDVNDADVMPLGEVYHGNEQNETLMADADLAPTEEDLYAADQMSVVGGFSERRDVCAVDDADPIPLDVAGNCSEDVFVVEDTDPVTEEHTDRCSDNESAADSTPTDVVNGRNAEVDAAHDIDPAPRDNKVRTDLSAKGSAYLTPAGEDDVYAVDDADDIDDDRESSGNENATSVAADVRTLVGEVQALEAETKVHQHGLRTSMERLRHVDSALRAPHGSAARQQRWFSSPTGGTEDAGSALDKLLETEVFDPHAAAVPATAKPEATAAKERVRKHKKRKHRAAKQRKGV